MIEAWRGTEGGMIIVDDGHRLSNTGQVIIGIKADALVRPGNEVGLRTVSRLDFSLDNLIGRNGRIILISSKTVNIKVKRVKLSTQPRGVPRRRTLTSVKRYRLVAVCRRHFAACNRGVDRILLARSILSCPRDHRGIFGALSALLR